MEEKKLRQYIRNFILEIKDDDDDLEEVTTTGNQDGYGTPHAFSKGDKKSKRKRKRFSTNSTGYSMMGESIDKEDVKFIKQLIRDVISDVYRDIWLKRNSWKNLGR